MNFWFIYQLPCNKIDLFFPKLIVKQATYTQRTTFQLSGLNPLKESPALSHVLKDI